jgi:hypothetical protein
MLFLYGIRAFIRSQLLYNITHKLENKIRETSKIPGTSEIPTRVIVSFGWQQLGLFFRALLFVIPIAIIVLVLINTLGQWNAFRISGSVVTVLGTLTIISFLAIESYVPALQATAVVAWLISILGIGLGRSEPLNSAVMATACTILTSFFIIALAFIPQTISKKPKRRAAEILLPLWLIELPIAILCHYYNISSPHFELWVLLIGIFSIFILFGGVVASLEFNVYLSLSRIIALASLSIGIPMAMVWSYAPLHGNHLPLYGAIIVTFASVALFCYLEPLFDKKTETSSSTAVFFIALGCLVAIPITLVWDTLPSNNIFVPRYVQISVTCGSNVVFATFLLLVHPYLKLIKWLAFGLYLSGTAACLPALLWAGEIDALKGLTDNHMNTIHVTWTSILFWIITWWILSMLYESCLRKIKGHNSV